MTVLLHYVSLPSGTYIETVLFVIMDVVQPSEAITTCLRDQLGTGNSKAKQSETQVQVGTQVLMSSLESQDIEAIAMM